MNVYARSDNEPMRPAAVAMSRTHPADQEALRHLEGHGIPNFVGWVGGLAVMAGIGAAMIIGGWSGVAAADGTDSSDGSSMSPSSPSDPSPAQQAPRPVARTIHDALSSLRTLATPGGLGFAPSTDATTGLQTSTPAIRMSAPQRAVVQATGSLRTSSTTPEGRHTVAPFEAASTPEAPTAGPIRLRNNSFDATGPA